MKKRILVLTLILCLALTLLPATASAGNGNTEFPQVVTAFLKIKFECGCKATGSGGIIRPDGLITAGHNLLCKIHNKPAASIDFYFGALSTDNYWYKYTGKFTTYVFCDFSNGYTSENDIGIVKFSKRVGDSTGWYGWDYGDATEYAGEKAFISSYNPDAKGLIYQATLSAYDDARVTFDHKALPESADGSPIYYLRGTGRNPALIGVYTGCEGETCFGSVINLDVALKIMDMLDMNAE